MLQYIVEFEVFIMALYAISGAPCSGKSTLIDYMKELGYETIPEASEILIKQERGAGSDCLPTNPARNIEFQNMVFDKVLELEDEYRDHGTVFCDRSIIDGYAYVLYYDKEPLPIYEKISRNRYDKVFILEMLPDYEQTEVRSETREEAKKVDRLIRHAYRKFGYKPIDVPVFAKDKEANIEKRASLILDYIGK